MEQRCSSRWSVSLVSGWSSFSTIRRLCLGTDGQMRNSDWLLSLSVSLIRDLSFSSLTPQLTSEEEAKTKFEPDDFNETTVLQHMNTIFHSPHMKIHNSVFLFNLGVHYSISLNFTTYKHLIDEVIKLIQRKIVQEEGNMAMRIWKTTTSIEKENVHKMFAELPKNKTHWRFHTHQVWCLSKWKCQLVLFFGLNLKCPSFNIV